MTELSSTIEKIFSGIIDFGLNVIASLGTLAVRPVRGSMRLTARRFAFPERQAGYLTLIVVLDIAINIALYTIYSIGTDDYRGQQDAVIGYGQDLLANFWGLPVLIHGIVLAFVLDKCSYLAIRKKLQTRLSVRSS